MPHQKNSKVMTYVDHGDYTNEVITSKVKHFKDQMAKKLLIRRSLDDMLDL